MLRKANSIAVAFDMDDTLYAERDYVLSGFTAVAKYIRGLGVRCSFDPFEFMVHKLETEGRGRVFNNLALALGLDNSLSATLLQVYRRHTPSISLDEHALGAIQAAREISGLPINVITDGHRFVQRKKAAALELNSLVQRVWFSRDFGLSAEKPQTTVFLHMTKRTGIQPHNFIYVGDDPTKDFIAPKKLGARSIRVRTGRLKELEPLEGCEPDFEISSLESLPQVLMAIT